MAFTAVSNGAISGFGLSDALPGDPLPVTLSHFHGRHVETHNILDWETESEVNSSYFQLERSIDSKTFETIAKIGTRQTLSPRKRYSFVDSTYQSGLNYYRLKMVDLDGSYSFSRIVLLKGEDGSKMEVYPNPVSTLLTIKSSGKNPGPTRIEIINAAGQVVLRHEKVKTQHGEVQLDVSKIPAGLYQVLINSSKSYRSFPIVKLP